MHISLSDHFTNSKIFKITISPILMMLFISMYGIVDGFFISNFAGSSAYSGVNLIMPIIFAVGGIGFMFGTGGSALSSKYLGEGRKDKANKVFTMMLVTVLVVGITLSIVAFIFIRPIAFWLGSLSISQSEGMVEEAIKYGRVIALGQVFFMLQSLFHSYFVVDEKPQLGFRYTIFAGLTNMVFDFLFIAIFKWGSIGAAIATVLGYMVGSIFPLIHFIKNKNGNINLVKCRYHFRPVLKCCANGSSEFVNNISSNIVCTIFNIQLLKYYGENGVAAYGTLMYVSFMFVAIHIGYSIGMAPVIGYNYGAQNKKELKNVLNRSLIIILGISILMLIAGELLGPVFSKLYTPNDPTLLDLTIFAFRINSIQFIFCGSSIFISSFFTALNNGLISAIISFLRTLVIQIILLFALPAIFGKEAIWWSIVVSEFMSLLLAYTFLIINKKRYGY